MFRNNHSRHLVAAFLPYTLQLESLASTVRPMLFPRNRAEVEREETLMKPYTLLSERRVFCWPALSQHKAAALVGHARP